MFTLFVLSSPMPLNLHSPGGLPKSSPSIIIEYYRVERIFRDWAVFSAFPATSYSSGQAIRPCPQYYNYSNYSLQNQLTNGYVVYVVLYLSDSVRLPQEFTIKRWGLQFLILCLLPQLIRLLFGGIHGL